MILTLDQVKKRGRCLANRYFPCRMEEETIHHILIYCVKARMQWQLPFAFFGVS